MPAGLSPFVSQTDYSASMARIQTANRSPIGTRLLMLLAWTSYVLSLLQVCGLFNVSGVSYDNYYVNGVWLGWSVGAVSFIALIFLARHSRKRRAAQVAAAVQLENATYSNRSPALAWRVVDERFIEVEVLDVQQQHHIASLEHQVHVLQAQMAAQAHHQAVDHELIAHQAAAAAAAQYAPPHYAPSAAPAAPLYPVQYYPTVASPSVRIPVAEPVFVQPVYQPAAGSVFAHPPPQYYANQTRSDMRAPLVQHQF